MPSRAILEVDVRSSAGLSQSGALVYVYETDGATLLFQPMYSAANGGTLLTNPLHADTLGFALAYVDIPQPCVIKANGIPIPAAFSPDPTSFGTSRVIDITTAPYGAVGDGDQVLGSTDGTDNTDSIQAAATDGGLDPFVSFTLRVPPGVFNLKDLRIPPGTKLIGSGLDISVLKRTAARVTSIKVTNEGTLYLAVPTVTISGGGGSGATAVATVSGGKITKITLVNQGDGYTSDPTVTVAAPGGGGVTCTATASCAFISETESSAGAQSIWIEGLTINGNGLGTHGLALGFSNQAGGTLYAGVGGPQWATRGGGRDVVIRKCTNGDGLRAFVNVVDTDHFWLLENKRNLYLDGSNWKSWQLNCESGIDREIVCEALHSTFYATQMEISAGSGGIYTGTDAAVLFTSFSKHNYFEAFIATPAAVSPATFPGDIVQVESGAIGNRFDITTNITTVTPIGSVLNDQNNADSHFSLSGLGSPANLHYEQSLRQRVMAGNLSLSPTSNAGLQQYHKTLTSGQATQCHETIDLPIGLLVITDDRSYAAAYLLEDTTTILLTGGDTTAWAAGTSLGGASKTTVYVTGGALAIGNQTGGARTYDMLFFAGPVA